MIIGGGFVRRWWHKNDQLWCGREKERERERGVCSEVDNVCHA